MLKFPILSVFVIILLQNSEAELNKPEPKSSLQNCSLDDGVPLFFYKKVTSNPSEILYSTYAPVIMEFLTPNWTNPINPTDYTCTGDNYEEDGYSCPVLWYWLTGVRDFAQNDIFVENLRIRDTSTFLRPNINKCDELSPIFDGLFLNPENKAEFLQSISNDVCVGERLIKQDGISDFQFTSAEMDAPYRRMREKFFEEYYQLQTPLNRSNDATYTNMRLNIDDAGLSNYNRESQRWKEALKDCSNNKMPRSLITPSRLTSALESVSNGAVTSGLKLSVSLDTLSTYYKVPLVDCAFTDDGLLVVIQVPLIEEIAEWKEISLISVPELKTSLHSDDEAKSICEIQDLDTPKPVLYEQNSNAVVEPNERNCFKSSGICHVPEVKGSMIKKPRSCSAYLLQENGNMNKGEMRQACDYGCMSIDTLKPPMVKRVGSDTFVIVGGGINYYESVKMICPEKEVQYVTASEEGGATEVQVPCGCTIVSPKYEKLYKVGLPCSDEFSAFEIHSNYKKKPLQC